MRSTTDNPVDPLGTLGKAIKPTAPAAPDPVKSFESATDLPLIADHKTVAETIAETLRRKHDRDEPTGCDFAEIWHLL